MSARHLPTHVRAVLDMRAMFLASPTVERFRAWLDAFEALSDSEASAYASAIPRQRIAPAAARTEVDHGQG